LGQFAVQLAHDQQLNETTIDGGTLNDITKKKIQALVTQIVDFSRQWRQQYKNHFQLGSSDKSDTDTRTDTDLLALRRNSRGKLEIAF
jgi:hypothetical protein